jgi:hypothetical protein
MRAAPPNLRRELFAEETVSLSVARRASGVARAVAHGAGCDRFILMANAAKVAISLDASLLARVESIRATTGESRSAFISRALVALVKEQTRARAVSRYVDAYREHPEAPVDVAAARNGARRALARVPWDDT